MNRHQRRKAKQHRKAKRAKEVRKRERREDEIAKQLFIRTGRYYLAMNEQWLTDAPVGGTA